MTDKQHETRQDTQKAAGELQGRAHAAGDTRQPRNTQQTGAEDKRREGRKEREGRGWPRAWGVVEGSEEGRKTHGSREGTERTDRKKDMIYI